MLSAFLAVWSRGARRRLASLSGARIRVETLEDRALPSSMPVVSFLLPSDGGYVSREITDAAGNTVTVGSAPDGANPNGTTWDFAIARYPPDGNLDPTFGDGGLVLTSISGGYDAASDVVAQPDGKLVVVGSENPPLGLLAMPAPFGGWALVRYNPDGSLDPTFGTGGEVINSFGFGDLGGGSADAVALQPDGGILVGGSAYGIGRNGMLKSSEFTIARYTADGILDRDFGNGGVVQIDFGDYDNVEAITVQPDGTILATGTSYQTSEPDADGNSMSWTLNVKVLLNPDGSFDGDLGSGGGETIISPPVLDPPGDVLPIFWATGTGPLTLDAPSGTMGSGADDAVQPSGTHALADSPVTTVLPQPMAPPPGPGQDNTTHQVAVLLGAPSPQAPSPSANSPPAPTGTGPGVVVATPASAVPTPGANVIESGTSSSRQVSGESAPGFIVDETESVSQSVPNQKSGEDAAVQRDDYFARLSAGPLAVPARVEEVLAKDVAVAATWPEAPVALPPPALPAHERTEGGFGSWPGLAVALIAAAPSNRTRKVSRRATALARACSLFH
jgi:uncharacterized delta-60 repeat protein